MPAAPLSLARFFELPEQRPVHPVENPRRDRGVRGETDRIGQSRPPMREPKPPRALLRRQRKEPFELPHHPRFAALAAG
jgi:hypothetical protein